MNIYDRLTVASEQQVQVRKILIKIYKQNIYLVQSGHTHMQYKLMPKNTHTHT